MNREILEILACPIDKFHPLDLFECKTEIEKIVEGVLYCKKCSRFFPIIDEIPIMLPDLFLIILGSKALIIEKFDDKFA